jgi:hypothetical protein
VSPVKYELRFYIPEDDILHTLRSGNLKSYEAVPIKRLWRSIRVLPVKYKHHLHIKEGSHP